MMYMFPPFQAFVPFPWLPGLPDPEFFWCIFTGFRAKALCLLVHAEASVSLSGVSFSRCLFILLTIGLYFTCAVDPRLRLPGPGRPERLPGSGCGPPHFAPRVLCSLGETGGDAGSGRPRLMLMAQAPNDDVRQP